MLFWHRSILELAIVWDLLSTGRPLQRASNGPQKMGSYFVMCNPGRNSPSGRAVFAKIISLFLIAILPVEVLESVTISRWYCRIDLLRGSLCGDVRFHLINFWDSWLLFIGLLSWQDVSYVRAQLSRRLLSPIVAGYLSVLVARGAILLDMDLKITLKLPRHPSLVTMCWMHSQCVCVFFRFCIQKASPNGERQKKTCLSLHPSQTLTCLWNGLLLLPHESFQVISELSVMTWWFYFLQPNGVAPDVHSTCLLKSYWSGPRCNQISLFFLAIGFIFIVFFFFFPLSYPLHVLFFKFRFLNGLAWEWTFENIQWRLLRLKSIYGAHLMISFDGRVVSLCYFCSVVDGCAEFYFLCFFYDF